MFIVDNYYGISRNWINLRARAQNWQVKSTCIVKPSKECKMHDKQVNSRNLIRGEYQDMSWQVYASANEFKKVVIVWETSKPVIIKRCQSR